MHMVSGDKEDVWNFWSAYGTNVKLALVWDAIHCAVQDFLKRKSGTRRQSTEYISHSKRSPTQTIGYKDGIPSK